MKRRITDQEMQRIREDAAEVLRPGPMDRILYLAKVRKYSTPVVVEVPTGALIDDLAGYAWVWKGQRRLEGPLPIVTADRFDAQGVEGKYRITMTLWDALFVWLFSQEHRIQIFRTA